MNIRDKKGNIIKKIKDIFSEDLRINTESSYSNSDQDKYNSEENAYIEITDSVSGYSRFPNTNLNKLNPIENSFQSNNKSASVNTKTKTKTKTNTMSGASKSYNPESALINSKIYKVNL